MTSESNFDASDGSSLQARAPSADAVSATTRRLHIRKRAPLRKAPPGRSGKVKAGVPVLIVDQSDISRAGLAHMLAESRFHVIGSYSSLAAASERKDAAGFRIALVNLRSNDAELSLLMRQYEDLSIIAMADQFRVEELLAVMKAGASGYLIKPEMSRAGLLATLDLVLLGAAVIPRFIEKVAAPKTPRREGVGETVPTHDLSGREKTILALLTRGDSNKLIARELDIAEATVKVHVKSLLRKIGVVNRTQAAMWAMKRAQPDPQPAELT